MVCLAVVSSLICKRHLIQSIILLYFVEKLEHCGITGVELSWFSSHLSKRKQFVSVNGSTSGHLDISCGVQQGSFLGPLLFLMYVNDLPSVSKVLSFIVFADDTNIFYSSSDLKCKQNVFLLSNLKEQQKSYPGRVSRKIKKSGKENMERETQFLTALLSILISPKAVFF